MFTLTVQLLLTGFLVAVLFQRFFSSRGSRIIYLDLALSVLGAFLGTMVEVWLRSLWQAPLMAQIILQYVIPVVSSIFCVLVYRLLNRNRE